MNRASGVLALAGLCLSSPVLGAQSSQARTAGTPIIFESADVVVFEKGCATSSFGYNILQVVFKSKDAGYDLSSDNPANRSLFETTLFPLVKRRCPLNSPIAVASYVADIHIDAYLNEFDHPLSGEAEVGGFVVTSGPSGFTYRTSGYHSLAELRASRAQSAMAAKRAAERDAAKAEAEQGRRAVAAAAASTVAKARADRERLLPTLSGPVRAWYTGILDAKATTRADSIRRLGTVRLRYERSAAVQRALADDDASRLLGDAMGRIGLRTNTAADAELRVSLVFESAVNITRELIEGTDIIGTRAYATVSPVWATASIHLPATIMRERGYVRADAVIASATTARMINADRPTAEAVQQLIAESVEMLADDARIDLGGVTDEEWRDSLDLQIGRVEALYANFASSAVSSADGQSGSLAGIDSVLRVDVGVSPFNRVPILDLRENFLGVRTWNPEPIWQRAVTNAGVALGAPRLAPKFLPRVWYRVSGTSVVDSVIRGREGIYSGIMGEASVVEANCVVSAPGGRVRIPCMTWEHAGWVTGFLANSRVRIFDTLDEKMLEQANQLERTLRRSRLPSAPTAAAVSTVSVIPVVRNTPRTAYDRLNAGRPAGRLRPLLYTAKGGKAFIAGIDARTSEFIVMEVPHPQILETIRDLQESLRRNRGRPNATQENLEKAIKQAHPSYAFAMDSYGAYFTGIDAFPIAARDAPLMEFDGDR